MNGRFYLTTTLPYANAAPHLGFALELVQADAYVRYRQLLGDEVFFNTGTDEHGLKIYRRARAAGVSPQDYVDGMAVKFKELLPALGILPEVNFIRTTDPQHLEAAQEFWRRCEKAGDIYKKIYQAKYCVGCELEKTESELANGRCPLHPEQNLEIIKEENYFFRFSKYRDKLLAFYDDQPDFVLPRSRLNEVKKFVERGLADFSISRLKAKMPWGIEVPGDPDQVIYVWFDALVNYLTAIGWPGDQERFERWWPVLQLAGKDNLRQQAAMWQAMLFSAGLPPSRQIVIHGFITAGGQKMAKSLGQVIDPFPLVREYGSEAVRYFLLRHVHPFEDSEVTLEKFKAAYNAHLANGLGNLVSRIMKLAESHLQSPPPSRLFEPPQAVRQALADFDYNLAADFVWQKISELDQEIQREEPFRKIKSEPATARQTIRRLVVGLGEVGSWLEPFLPQTSAAVKTAIQANQSPPPLFPRK